MTTVLSLKIDEWPARDRELWEAARQPRRFRSGHRPASRWSGKRCRIVEQSYGQWLSWLLRNGLLNAEESIEERVTPQRIEEFVVKLQGRVAPWSVAMMVGALKRMHDVLAPETDWQWLNGCAAYLKANAEPSRNRLAHMVSPEQLYDLGLALMAEATDASREGRYHAATKGRDGLMIAMLICCPIRIANLVQIEIGRHLLFDVDRYWLRFSEDETKTGQELRGELPPELTPWINQYFSLHRVRLLARKDGATTARLWVDRWGQPMAEHSIRAQIKKRSRDAFGRHVWPHLFRAIAVTGLVDHAPEHFAVAPDLLGHSNDRTTRKHYILSQGMQAHKVVQDTILRGRAEALERWKARR